MRYFFSKNRLKTCALYGKTYTCNHPLYNSCTLYSSGKIGLAVIQQRFDRKEKLTWWGKIDKELVDDIFEHPDFETFYFNFAAEPDSSGLYPTVTVRQVMWALRMKPLPKQRWETVFDHKPI